MAKGGGLVAFYGRVRAMARGQHGAMCALAHLALRSMPPPGRDLAFARALLRACEELTKSLARAAAAGKRGRAGGGGAVARASVRGKAVGAGGGGDDDEVEGEDGQARRVDLRQRSGQRLIRRSRCSRRARGQLCFSLLIAHLTTALESLFAPQRTAPPALPSTLVACPSDGRRQLRQPYNDQPLRVPAQRARRCRAHSCPCHARHRPAAATCQGPTDHRRRRPLHGLHCSFSPPSRRPRKCRRAPLRARLFAKAVEPGYPPRTYGGVSCVPSARWRTS